MIVNLADACIVIGEIERENASLKERIAELEQEIEELKEVAAIIDHQRDMERVIRYNAGMERAAEMAYELGWGSVATAIRKEIQK